MHRVANGVSRFAPTSCFDINIFWRGDRVVLKHGAGRYQQVVFEGIEVAGSNFTQALAPQADPGWPLGYRSIIDVHHHRKFHLKDRRQVITQVLGSFEAEARGFPLSGINLVRRVDTICVGVAVIDIAHIGDAVNRDIALCEGGAGDKAGDGQSDDFFLHFFGSPI